MQNINEYLSLITAEYNGYILPSEDLAYKRILEGEIQSYEWITLTSIQEMVVKASGDTKESTTGNSITSGNTSTPDPDDKDKKGEGTGNNLPEPKYDTSKLQHEFKHASDFGVEGNWNKANGEAFQNALNNHVNSSDTILQSTYRGQDVNVYINSTTGNGTYFDLNGNFIGGWKFSLEQMNFHLTNGIPIP